MRKIAINLETQKRNASHSLPVSNSMSETSCAYTVYELCIYIYIYPDKTWGHALYTRIINAFAKPYRLSFLCIEGARVNGERII